VVAEGVNHAGLAAVGGRLFVLGGNVGVTFTPTGAVRIFVLAGWRGGVISVLLQIHGAVMDTWAIGPPAPTLDGAIYVLGGGPTAGPSFSSANERFTP